MQDPEVQARLDEIASEYVQRCQDGENPSIEEFASRHWDISRQIREFLQTLKVVIGLHDPEATRKPRISLKPGISKSDARLTRANDEVPTSDSNIERGDSDSFQLSSDYDPTDHEAADTDPQTSDGAHKLRGKATDRDMPETLGRFRIESVLGRGGMGVVYLATDTQLDRNVAIKLLKNKLVKTDEWSSRFRREAKITSALNHPNVLTIYEIGETDGRLYMASEFIAGVTLAEKIIDDQITFDEALSYATQLVSGVAACQVNQCPHFVACQAQPMFSNRFRN